nr:MAG TPA: hypothetical protein [Caudoviricetes sp.]
MRVRTGRSSEKSPIVKAMCSCPLGSSKPCIVKSPHSVGRRQEATNFKVLFMLFFLVFDACQCFQRLGKCQRQRRPICLGCVIGLIFIGKFNVNHAQNRAVLRCHRDGQLASAALVPAALDFVQRKPISYIVGNIHPTALRRTAGKVNRTVFFMNSQQIFQRLALRRDTNQPCVWFARKVDVNRRAFDGCCTAEYRIQSHENLFEQNFVFRRFFNMVCQLPTVFLTPQNRAVNRSIAHIHHRLCGQISNTEVV